MVGLMADAAVLNESPPAYQRGLKPARTSEQARALAMLSAQVRKAKLAKLDELNRLVDSLSEHIAQASPASLALALSLKDGEADLLKQLQAQVVALAARIDSLIADGDTRKLRDLAATLECLRRQERMLRSPIREAPGMRERSRKRSTPTPV